VLVAPVVLALALLTSRPAAAQVLWDGDADRGLGVFASVLCDGGAATTTDWGDGRGAIFSLNKKVGSPRCELHSIDSEELLGDGRTLWFGWGLSTKTGNAQTVFQWKSNGANEQNQQNYPVILKVEDSRLKAWYVAPGETWVAIGSAPWTTGTWHDLQVGIGTSAGTDGWVEVHLDGTLLASRTGVRTWDDRGNQPRWGTYGTTITDTASHVWVDDPRLATTRGDLA
jgi:hypothetical protein